MWSIGELAERAGIQASAIRYYESIGLLPEPERVNGRRRYDPSTLGNLELINAARACGFQIREIQVLLHGFPDDTPAAERWMSLTDQKIEEIDQRIQQLQQVRDLLEFARRCQCASLDECATVLDQEAQQAKTGRATELVGS